jgi:hypothetical protein
MKDLLVLLAHLLTTIAKLPGPGGARTVVADSLIMKQQLLVINGSRLRAPNLSALDRFLVAVSRSTPYPASCRDYSAIDASEISRPAQEAQVPAAVLIRQKREARPPGSITQTHPGDR